MKFAFTAILVSFIPATLAVTLGYDSGYGVGSNSLTTVACSDGVNGLITRGFNNYGDVPSFPYIASSSAVTGWNSTACGSCWSLTYTNPSTGAGTTITVTAIDHANDGFYTSVAALDEITGGHAVEWGHVDVVAEEVDAEECGL